MSLKFSPKNNPRVIIIQKLYGQFFNKEEKLDFPKHRFKKFIKDVVSGTLERDEVINEEINTYIHFILDRSGSMYEIIHDTIGGFNSFIKQQKDNINKDYEIIDNNGNNIKQKTNIKFSLLSQ